MNRDMAAPTPSRHGDGGRDIARRGSSAARRERSLLLRKYRLGDFHQLFQTREDQGDIGLYRLGDVIVLHGGWREQGLADGAMVTVRRVVDAGVEVYFECREEEVRYGVLPAQELCNWNLTVHRQPAPTYVTRAPRPPAPNVCAVAHRASVDTVGNVLIEDW